MKRIGPALFILWILSAIPCFAASTRIASGEHGAFTRLVAYLPTGSEWSLKSDQNGAKLLLTVLPSIDFDTSALFDRIGKDRIKTVNASDGTMSITLACACGFKAFELQSDIVVIDISQDFFVDPPPEKATLQLQPIRSPHASELMSRGLERAFSNATASGLLEQALGQQIKVTTAHEKSAPARLEPDKKEPVQTAQCVPEHFLDLATWAGQGDFSAERAQLRSRLPDSNGQLTGPNLISLAQFYLANGLADEALMLLYPYRTPQAEALRSVAILIKAPEALPIFAGQIECDSPSSLWGVIAHGFASSKEADVFQGKVLDHFSQLPLPLQDRLFPELLDRFRSVKANGAAEWLLDWSERRGTISRGQLVVLSTEPGRGGAPDSSTSHTDIFQTPKDLAKPALLKSFANYDTAAASTEEDQTLFRAFLREGQTPLWGSEIWAARLRLLAVEADYRAVIHELTHKTGHGVPEVVGQTLEFISKTYPDIDFLKFALILREQTDLPPKPLLTPVNQRLIQLGFPDRLLGDQTAKRQS